MPPFPMALVYLWRAYLRLRRRCGVGFSGPQPVGWIEIDAFARLSGIALAPWEIGLIEAIDDLYLRRGVKPPTAATESASASDPAAVRALLRGWKPAKNERGEADG